MIKGQRVTAVIQARMGSSRLAGKSMLPICNKPILEHVINRVKAIKNINNIVVATSYIRKNEVIIDLACKLKCNVITGSEENVLERFNIIDKLYTADYMLRVTGDNPLIDPFHASKMIEYALSKNSDLMDMGEIPIGIGVELVKSTALHESNRDISVLRDLKEKKRHQEHVTTYIKEHPEKYKYLTYNCGIDVSFKDIRFTVDYESDYNFVKKIYEKLYKNNNIFSIEEIILFLKQNRELINSF
jgi:spore coat polysaccharide biosynthesis protein SpsF